MPSSPQILWPSRRTAAHINLFKNSLSFSAASPVGSHRGGHARAQRLLSPGLEEELARDSHFAVMGQRGEGAGGLWSLRIIINCAPLNVLERSEIFDVRITSLRQWGPSTHTKMGFPDARRDGYYRK